VTTTIETDVLVIGAGGAGMRAAYDSHLSGARVTVAVKGRFGSIGTRGAGTTAAGVSEIGLMRMIGYDDQWSGEWDGAQTRQGQVFGDIIQAGLGMADRSIVRVVVEEAAAARKALEDWGMVPTFAHGYGAKTHGVPIKIALESRIRHSDVDVRERTAVVRLLTGSDGACLGGIAVDEKSGEVVVIRAAATIIAAGGMGRLYSHSFHPSCGTGDAYSLAYLAGAELMNMEFHQIFLGSVQPTVNLVSSWLWRRDPRITNKDGQEFVQNYLPLGRTVDECIDQRRRHTPFSTRDELSRFMDVAILREVKAGRGTPSKGIFVEIDTDERNGPFSDVGEWYRYRGVHWDRGPVEMSIFHHCSNGGIKVDENAQTCVPGLYAIGEAAAGAHGADRLGGMLLVSSQVFGSRAGRLAAAGKATSEPAPADQVREVEAQAADFAAGPTHPDVIGTALADLTWAEILVERSAAGLSRALTDIKAMQEDEMGKLGAPEPLGVVRGFEVMNGLVTAEAVARACLERTESRGGHYRADHPERDDTDWLMGLVVQRADERMTVRRHPIDPDWKPRRADMWGTKWG
jgi:fumarate reductase (CoM/CoB) subunit A